MEILGIQIDRFIALVSSIAVLLTSIIILFTLFEMKKQRRSLYRPDLILTSNLFYVYAKDLYHEFHPFIWSCEKYDGEIEKHKTSTNYFINFYNIGLGSAKFLKINWEFNYKKLFSEINKLKQKDDFEIKLNKEFLLYSLGDKYSVRIQLDADNYYEINHSLPSHITKEQNSLRLPTSYFDLISIYIFYLIKNFKNDFDKIFNFIKECPSLKLKISYYDIENNNHTQTFKVVPKFSMLKFKRSKKYTEIAFGFFNINK